MKRWLSSIVALSTLGVAGLVVPAVLAQDDGPTLLQVNLVRIKPEASEQFRELHKTVFMPAAKEAGTPWRAAWTAVFGESFETAIVVPIKSFAAFDQEPPNAAVSATDELAGELWRHTVDSRRVLILEELEQLSMQPAEATTLARFATIDVHQGKTAEFEALWKSDILPAIKKSGITGYVLYRVAAGGSSSEYRGFMPLKKFADLDGFDIFGGLSEQELAALNAKTASVIRNVEVVIATLDAELSYGTGD